MRERLKPERGRCHHKKKAHRPQCFRDTLSPHLECWGCFAKQHRRGFVKQAQHISAPAVSHLMAYWKKPPWSSRAKHTTAWPPSTRSRNKIYLFAKGSCGLASAMLSSAHISCSFASLASKVRGARSVNVADMVVRSDVSCAVRCASALDARAAACAVLLPMPVLEDGGRNCDDAACIVELLITDASIADGSEFDLPSSRNKCRSSCVSSPKLCAATCCRDCETC